MLPEGLSLHPSSRVRRRSGRTALHVAATHGRLLETQHLLEAGADVHASDNDGPERVGFFQKGSSVACGVLCDYTEKL